MADFYRALAVAATPTEVTQALKTAARRLDLAVKPQPDGGMLLLSRWPDHTPRIDVKIVAGEGSTHVQLSDATLLRGIRSMHSRVLLDRISESVKATSGQHLDSMPERPDGVVISSRLLRFGQTLFYALGLSLIGAGLFGPWHNAALIPGIWLFVVVPSCMEILRRRLIAASSRDEPVGLAVLLVLAVGLTCAALFA